MGPGIMFDGEAAQEMKQVSQNAETKQQNIPKKLKNVLFGSP